MIQRTLIQAGWIAALAILAVPVLADSLSDSSPAPAAAPADSKTPQTGQKAPNFTLKADDGKSYPLSNYRGRWTVLAFYPKDFTSGCTAEACSLRDEKKNIEALNARFFGISVQDLASHRDFAAKYNLNYRLLADDKQEIAKAYGVLMDGPSLAKRYTFYIDPMGIIRKVDDKVQPTSAGKDVIDNLKALQSSIPAPSIDDLNKQIRPLNKKLATDPNDKGAASELSVLLYLRGHALMTNKLLPKRDKYAEALKQFSRALTLNPGLVAAQEDKSSIEAIYQSAGEPVPT